MCEPAEGVTFDMGEITHLASQIATPSTKDCIQTDMEDLPKALRPGDLISFNDGDLGAVCLEVTEASIKIQFKEAGTVLPFK